MPITISPPLDERRYQDLLNEMLARIPVHTPEWTNVGPSDPGRTLVELFCFLAENVLYQANQIPERNRRKFLQLLDVPLQAGGAARGLVTFANERGVRRTETLNRDLEVRAGAIPFQTERALDVLPIEARVYYKRRVQSPEPRLEQYYRLLYASYRETTPAANIRFDMYEAVPLEVHEPDGIDLGTDAVDGSLWIALLTRAADAPGPGGWDELRENARAAIERKTLSLGIVPALQEGSRRLTPSGRADLEGEALLRYELPKPPALGKLPDDVTQRIAQYQTLEPRTFEDVLTEPGVVEIPLPGREALRLWTNLDPLEAGVGDFPPALGDTTLDRRVVTWLRVRAAGGSHVRLLWAGINAMTVAQRAHVYGERLADGSGMPDQTRTLSRTPVVAGSVALDVTPVNGTDMQRWQEIDDLLLAGPEVDVPDPRLPPGTPRGTPRPSAVFAVDAEAGTLRFGDGMRGKRPPEGATMRASYDYSVGAAGNVAAGMIDRGPALPAGFVTTNPVRTWGGADPETVAQGEKQVARHLQHRDRLVTAADFATIARRAPGIDIGRIDVLPAFHPELSPNEPGDAPGVVTLMVLPRHDPLQPDAPQPDRAFLNALCRHLDPRRLVTTEIVLKGPDYVGIWISVGIGVKSGHAASDVREAVRSRLLAFLAPLYPETVAATEDDPDTEPGWPLRKDVNARELMAEASRVKGVLMVNDLLLAKGSDDASPSVSMAALQLPRVLGISVTVGDPQGLDTLRGAATDALADVAPDVRMIPVPFIPEEC